MNYRTDDFVAVTRAFSAGHGMDLILDMVGGDYTPRNIASLADDGRLVQIALLRGAAAEVDLGVIMRRRLTLTGSTLRPRSIQAKAAIAQALEAHVWPLIERGEVKPVIHAVVPLERASEAHRMMEDGAHIGKIVLAV
jgi:NADPH2:quinone reductase